MSLSEPNDRDITTLYQDNATEIPGAAIDQKILDLARQKLVTNVNSTAPKFSSRKWHWPVSIAASVMLVSVIFINNQSVFLDPAETILIDDKSANADSLAQPIATQSIQESLPVSVESSNRLVEKEQKVNPISQQTQVEINQIRAQGLADNSQRQAEQITETTQQLRHTRVLKEHEAQQAQQRLSMLNEAKLQAKRNIEIDMDIQDNPQESDVIQVTGSRLGSAREAEISEVEAMEAMEVNVLEGSELTMDSFSTLDVDYLDALVLDLKTLENNKNLSQSAQQEAALILPKRSEETQALSEEERLQQAIYDELLAFKMVNPDAKLPEKYLILLAKNQLIELFNAVEQDRPNSLQNKEEQ
jgi:hypothetical protein